MKQLQVLDLFSGIGGFSLGLAMAGMETKAFVEIDTDCHITLRRWWPNVPIYPDIRSFDAKKYRGLIDVVCGGFPCQPYSVAGKQRGGADKKGSLAEMRRVINECQPTWVIGENVSGFVNMALDDCISDLEAEGYEVQPFIIPACAVEAYHRRDRVWVVAYSGNSGRGSRCGHIERGHLQGYEGATQENKPERNGWERGPSASRGVNGPVDWEAVANSCSGRLDRQREREIQLTRGAQTLGASQTLADAECKRQSGPGVPREPSDKATCSSGETDRINDGGKGNDTARVLEPGLGGASYGLPRWMDGFNYVGDPDASGMPRITTRKDGRSRRIKGLGNAVVPEIPEIIGRAIVAIEWGLVT